MDRPILYGDVIDKHPHKHIALFGPIAPWRGGIAQYTTQLHRALRAQPEVTLQTISFKRQYPSFLYPGRSETEPHQAMREADVSYVIDIYNPLSWRRAAKEVADNGCELAVFDWWTIVWQPGFAYMARYLRRRGVKTAYLCHNLFDHDTKGMQLALSKLLLRQADMYIVQSNEQKATLEHIKPGARIVLEIHPIYDQFPEPIHTLPKRGRLEILFFGFIRPYKGLAVLLEALAQLNDKEIFVTVAGEPWGDSDELKNSLEAIGAPNLELHLEYTDDPTTATYFDRADVVALPYLSATGSGIVALAYNYEKPVVASAVGGLVDAVVDEKTGWLVPANSPADLAQRIRSIRRGSAAKMAPAIRAFSVEHSWERLAKDITAMTDD